MTFIFIGIMLISRVTSQRAEIGSKDKSTMLLRVKLHEHSEAVNFEKIILEYYK